ncbi:MFS transporter [Paraburkholderia bonniea]|uniref:MFS transporter n=1 Tax=Paraburkholderia bonniea TaxID=2152891 RepID=UPI00129172F0|nr:MFS transporter [Paraburkholderia bonniea]WJF90872.1 MFS transporter [Paraburkholderia bonniea]WJF94187.1 MFS transporter [Paraburkholderia bonniea]
MKIIFTRDFIALILSVAVVGLGSGATLPLTALALTQAGYGSDIVGLLSAAQAGGGLLIAPLTGWITRRYGGRQVIMAAVLVAGLSTALMQTSTSLFVWAVLRVLCGAALMLLFTIGEAWVNQLADDANRGRIVAIYATHFTLFQMAGPVLVSQIEHFTSWRFLLCGVIFLGALPVLAAIRAAPASSSANEAHGGWLQVLPLMPAIIVGTGFFALFDTIALSLMPLFAMDHGVSSRVAVLFASALLLGDTTMQLPLGWLADRIGRTRVHLGSAVVVVILLPLLPWAISSPWLCWPLLFVLGAAAGAIYTLSLVACGERFRGTALVSASSVVGASWCVASFAGPLVTGSLMKHTGNNAMIAVLLATALAFLLAMAWEKRRAVPPAAMR